MRPKRRHDQGWAPAKRRQRARSSGGGALVAAWRRWITLENQRLRLQPLVSKVGALLPAPREPRTLYDLVASLQPATRRCLIGVLAFGVVILTTWLFIFTPRGLIARTALADMIAAGEATNAAIEAENLALQAEIARLENDDEMIETVARNELNLALPDESIYRPREAGPPAYVLKVRAMTETAR